MVNNVEIKKGKFHLAVAGIATALAALKVAIGLAKENKKIKYILYILAIVDFIIALFNIYKLADLELSPEDDELSEDLEEEDFFDEDLDLDEEDDERNICCGDCTCDEPCECCENVAEAAEKVAEGCVSGSCVECECPEPCNSCLCTSVEDNSESDEDLVEEYTE